MPVATARSSVASSSARVLGSRGEPPSQNVPTPSLSTNFAASLAFCSPIRRYDVQIPNRPSSMPTGSQAARRLLLEQRVHRDVRPHDQLLRVAELRNEEEIGLL